MYKYYLVEGISLDGDVAQLVEHLPCTHDVSGSTPLISTIFTKYKTPNKNLKLFIIKQLIIRIMLYWIV